MLNNLEPSEDVVAKILNAILPLMKNLVDDVTKVQSTQMELEILENKFSFLASQFLEVKIDLKKAIDDLYLKSGNHLHKEDFNKEIDRIFINLNNLVNKTQNKMDKEDFERELSILREIINEIKMKCSSRGKAFEEHQKEDLSSKKETYIQLGKFTLLGAILLTIIIEISLYVVKKALPLIFP